MNHAPRTLNWIASLALALWTGGASAQPAAPMKATCQVMGAAPSEPVGDTGHAIRVVHYSCYGDGGLTDGTVITGMVIWDVNGQDSFALSANGVYRKAGGIAVYEEADAKYSLTLLDGKVTGFAGSSKVIIKAAGGSLAPLAGKTMTDTFHSIPGGRFMFERTVD